MTFNNKKVNNDLAKMTGKVGEKMKIKSEYSDMSLTDKMKRH